MFGDPHWYQAEELPKQGYRVGHGVDLACSSKTWADRSVIATGYKADGLLYVVDCKIGRKSVDVFARESLKPQLQQYPGKARWYYSGMEKGIIQLLDVQGVKLNGLPATSDKFVRAQPAAAAWNQGKILLPATDNGHQHTWVTELIDEVCSFTGVGDAHDDIVDALDSLWDELDTQPSIHRLGQEPTIWL